MNLLKNYRTLENPIAFSGRSNIGRYVKKPKKEIEDDLFKINSYLLHREIKKPRNYNPIYVYARRKIIQGDLCDLSNIKETNDNVTFLLVLIDSFSRKAWVKPLKSKKGAEVLEAFKELIQDIGSFKVLYFDRGTEVNNNAMKKELQRRNIELRFPVYKVGTVERFLRTLQSLIYRYMTDSKKMRYIDALQDIVALYNNRYHRVIKCAPNFADKPENRGFVLKSLKEKYDKAESKRKKPKYKVGQSVLIPKWKNVFAKSYERTMVRRRYIISEVHDKMPQPMYSLKGELDEPIDGRFYESELQPVTTDAYTVSKILKRRKRRGVPYILVEWEGYENLPQYNQWIPESNLTDIT